MIAKCNEVGHIHNGVVSVGIINVEPAVFNVIPNKVTFIYDGRHESDHTLSKMHSELEMEFEKIASKSKGNSLSKPFLLEMEHL